MLIIFAWGRKRRYVIEWIRINQYFMNRTHNFKAMKKGEAFIRVPLSNLPLSLLINLLWNGVLQYLQEPSLPAPTFPRKKKKTLAFIFNVFSSLPYLNFLYSENCRSSLFLKLSFQIYKFKTSFIRRNNSYRPSPKRLEGKKKLSFRWGTHYFSKNNILGLLNN